MVVQIAAEIVPFAVVRTARNERRLNQFDLIGRVDGDELAVDPLVEHCARTHILGDGRDQLLE